MTLDQKKTHIFRCIKLGMELEKAYIIAECTLDEIDALENTPDFLSRVEAYFIRAEYELLEQHDEACTIAAAKGNANPIQWKLGKLNPKWENKDKDLNLKTPENVTVVLTGRSTDQDDSTENQDS